MRATPGTHSASTPWIGGHVPIGVLQARPGDPGAVSIHPAISKQEGALSLITTGPVTRIVMLFREEFCRKGKLARLGGSQAGQTLARPIRGTLYIAGEATVEEADSGTVHGAMRSGHRAAIQLARYLGVSA